MKTTLTSLLIAGALTLHAAEKTATPGTPMDFSTTQRCDRWEARWIGRSAEQGMEAPFVYARRSFTVDQPFASAVLHVSAAECYKVWVNGVCVGDGPPRNVHPSLFYSSYEIGSLLKPGNNALAIEYAGGRLEGVIAQLELRDADGKIIQTLTTDEAWKLTVGPWANSGAHTAGGNPTEVFDGRREPLDWKAPDFKDTGWPAATVVEKGLPKPAAGSDKNPLLEPSLLPVYQREIIRPAKIAFAGEVLEFMGDTQLSAGLQMVAEIPRPDKHTRIENADGLLGESKQPAVVHHPFAHDDVAAFNSYWDKHNDVPEVHDATLILDFGKLRNAFIQLDVEGTAGSLIDIAWGQNLVDGRVLPLLYARRQADDEGKPNQLNAHRYTLREGRQQWESFNYQNIRYLQLTFRRLNGPLRLHAVNAIASGLPWEQRGQFHCSDPLLERFYEMTANTLHAASYDSFMDNTIREKTIYGGDIADGAVPSCLSIYGDASILRNYMNLWTRAQDAAGRLPQQALGGTPSNFSAHGYKTGFWMAEYAYWCEDPEHYRTEIWPAVIRLLDYYKTQQNAQGLIIDQKEGGALWVDWCSGLMAPGKETPYPAQKLSVPVNLLYASLLQKAAEVADGFGEKERAAGWRSDADRIGREIYSQFWDEEAGLYLDGAMGGFKCSSHSEHSNYLALLNGLGRDGRSQRILEALLSPKSTATIVQSGPPFMIWPPKGLYAAGEDKAALDMLRSRYSRFLRMGLDTFSEHWTWTSASGDWNTRYRSLAQNAAGSPAWFLATEVLGVKPTKPGFTEFTICPQLGDLEWAEGIVPSPKGDIPVRVENKGNKLTLNATVPVGTIATVLWPDGKSTTLNPGKHTLSGSGKQ